MIPTDSGPMALLIAEPSPPEQDSSTGMAVLLHEVATAAARLRHTVPPSWPYPNLVKSVGNIALFAATDLIDLTGFGYSAGAALTYSQSTPASGVLKLTNGANIAQISLLGTYTASSFAIMNDNSGGTLVYTR